MTIRSKLILGFTSVIFLAVLIGVLGICSLCRVRHNIGNICDNLFPASTGAQSLVASVWLANANFKSLLVAQNVTQAKEHRQQIEAALGAMKKINSFLEDKFKGRSDILGHIENIKSGIEQLSAMNSRVYETVSSGIRIRAENADIKKRAVSLVQETIAAIAEQVDNAEFSALIANEEARQGIAEARMATEFLAKSYDTLSQKNYQVIRRLLMIKSGMYEGAGQAMRMLLAQRPEELPIYEDKFIAAMNYVEGRVQKMRDAKALSAADLELFSTAVRDMQTLVLKDIKGAAGAASRGGGNNQQIGDLVAQLEKKQQVLLPVIGKLIDDEEFEVIVNTDEATKGIKQGLAKNKLVEERFSQTVDTIMPLTKALLLLRGDLATALAIIEQILNNEDADYMAPLEDQFKVQIASAKNNVATLRAMKDIEKKKLDRISACVADIEKFIIGEQGILPFRRQLLANRKALEQTLSRVESEISGISALVSETVDTVSTEANQASKDTQQVVGATTGGIGISAGMAVLVGFLIAFFLSTFIVKNLAVLNRWVADLSGRKGDLTLRLRMQANDELGTLGKSFDGFLDNFTDMTKVIRTSSDNIDHSAKTLSVTSQQVNASLEGIAASMQQISKGASHQVGKVEEALKIIQDLSASLQGIAGRAGEVNKAAISVTALASQGKSGNQELSGKMVGLAKVIEDSSTAVAGLGHRSEQIGEISSTINSFADQTNLLALNAAIEAARAGDAGRGFAVVAEEVRKLAEASGRSASEIAKLIDAVQADVANVVVIISHGRKESEDGKVIAGKVMGLQENIVQAANQAEKIAGQISAVIPDQLSAAQRALSAIGDVSGVAQENASSTQEVSASIEQMSASMQELVSSADAMAGIVGNLQELVGQFKVD